MHLGTVGLTALLLKFIARNGTGNTHSEAPPTFPNGPKPAQRLTPLNIADQCGINFATWNVLTLNQPFSKLLLAKDLKRYKVIIAGITEMHLTRSGEEDILEGRALLWSGRNQRKVVVALVLNSFARKALL